MDPEHKLVQFINVVCTTNAVKALVLSYLPTADDQSQSTSYLIIIVGHDRPH